MFYEKGNRIAMKTQFSLSMMLAAAAFLVVMRPGTAGAGLFRSNAQMTDIHWTPAAGSITWSSNWELEASAASFDSASGHDHGDQSVTWSPGAAATAEASSLTAHSTAWAEVGVDASGNLIQLQSSAQTTTASGLYASASSCGSAYREFTLTGGAGSVDVNFSFGYSASLSGTADDPSQASLLNWQGTLRISDGTTTWDLTAANQRATPVDASFSGIAERTFLLSYGTPYAISFVIDPEVEPIPEASSVFAVVFLVVVILLHEDIPGI
jgi:hypothetical protein